MKNFFCLVSVFFSLVVVEAALAFSISPTKILLTIEPGKSSEVFVEVENNEKQDMVFSGMVLGARQDNEGRPVFLANYTAAEKWVKPKTNQISLKSGAKDKIYFAIQVPTNTPSGAYYLALVVQSVSAGGDVGLTGQIASLLNLQVSGLVSESVKINKWEFSEQKFDRDNWRFLLNLENSGNIEVLLDGNLSVSSWREREIFKEKLNLGNKLLAHSFRFLQPEFNLAKKSIYLPGLYRVKVDISYGKTNQRVVESVYVWYWPVWSKIVGLVLLFLVLVMFVWLGRRLRLRSS